MRRPQAVESGTEQVFGGVGGVPVGVPELRVMGVDPGLTRCGLGAVEGRPGAPLSLVKVGVVRTSADDEIGARLVAVEAGIEQWLDEVRPDAVAVERVFAQHNLRTVMGTAQASAVAILCASRRGSRRAAHPVGGQGRDHRQRHGRQEAGRHHGHEAAPARRHAQARRRRRRPRARHLPHLAGRRAEPPGRGRRQGGRPGAGTTAAAYFRGRGRAGYSRGKTQ
nr:hypothetical protein GCM10020093_030870 [Planobispora longispora]